MNQNEAPPTPIIPGQGNSGSYGNTPAGPPSNMTGGDTSNHDSGATIRGNSTVPSLIMYNNMLSTIEGGYWYGKDGIRPYLKIAPIFENMKGQQPTKGAAMYDYSNDVFIAVDPMYLQSLAHAFMTVKAAELKRIAGDENSRVSGMGIKIGNPDSADGKYVVFGNDLRDYGMYVALRKCYSGNIQDVLFDLTGDLSDTTHAMHQGYNHSKGVFESPAESMETPIGISTMELFLRYAVQSVFSPFGITPSSSGRGGRNAGPALIPNREPVTNSSLAPPVREITNDSVDLS